eukprot:6214151-Pleurochrysis_carterae.AAC.3
MFFYFILDCASHARTRSRDRATTARGSSSCRSPSPTPSPAPNLDSPTCLNFTVKDSSTRIEQCDNIRINKKKTVCLLCDVALKYWPIQNNEKPRQIVDERGTVWPIPRPLEPRLVLCVWTEFGCRRGS